MGSHGYGQGRRGAVFPMVIAMALALSVVAFGLLFMALTYARQGRFSKERIKARYAAEAALVWTMDFLWRNPTYCGGLQPFDTDGDGLQETNIDIAVRPCGPGNETRPHRVTATAMYNVF